MRAESSGIGPASRTDRPQRIAVIASASGNGKTTLGRELASRLKVQFVELDALVHGPDWAETSAADLLAQLAPILDRDGWVIDGGYERKLGTTVLDAAEMVVWLDLPIRVWMPRLAMRSWRRWRGHEELWNGNTETLSNIVWGRESLFGYALRTHFTKRRTYPQQLRRYNVRRLRTIAEVDSFIEEIGRST